MRLRIRFLAFLLVFLIFLPIFCIFLGDYLSRNENEVYAQDYELSRVKNSKKVHGNGQLHQFQGVIQQSVLLGYSNADKLTIFSAFNNNGKITVILSSYGYLNRRVYCRLFDENRREIASNPVSVFPEFTVKCSKTSKTARFVAVSVNKKDVLGNLHQISLRENGGQVSEFSVCLAPIFGESPKELMIIEFLEYYGLQGADNFLIYTYNISQDTENLLNFYKTRLNLTIIQIGNNTKCLNRHRCRHEMQLQDCIFRLQTATKWVATVDLDERIMMINEKMRIIDFLKISKIFENSKNSKNIAELRFRCQWTLRYSEIPPKTLKIDDLPMLKWHNTSHVAPQNHTTKSIIRPENVESMGVHGVQKFENSTFSVKLVEPELAVVRHYRLVQGWSFFLKEAEGFGEFRHFQLSDKLSSEIAQRVQRVLAEFSGFL